MPKPTSALIVDDEAHARTFVRMLLKQLGIATVWEATNGAAALEMVRAHRPELVLLDVNMPIMGGLATLSQLKEIDPDLPVIIVSSESAMPTVREAARLGAAGYLLKQSTNEQALEALREAFATIDADEQDEDSTD
jgi:DNA-binding NarL/FixJ family response regulator